MTQTTEETMTTEQTALVHLAPIADVRNKLEDRQYLQLIKDTHCPNATDLEFRHCIATAHHLGLDPTARQIFFIPVWDSRVKREQWVPVVSIDGLRAIAERTGEYEGRTQPRWCGQDAQWVDIWLSDTPPAGARVGVWRKGFKEALYSVATYREFCRRKKDGKPMALWATHPSHMLLKCCEAACLRAAFPREMAGDYGVKDVSLPGEPGRFRVKDTTDEVAESVTAKQLPAADLKQDLLQALAVVESPAKLQALGRAAKELPDAARHEVREAWIKAKERLEAAAKQPDLEPNSEHDYGPPSMSESEVHAIEAGDQGGFGFDGGEK